MVTPPIAVLILLQVLKVLRMLSSSFLSCCHPNTILISPQLVAHVFIVVLGVHHPPKAVHNHLAITRRRETDENMWYCRGWHEGHGLSDVFVYLCYIVLCTILLVHVAGYLAFCLCAVSGDWGQMPSSAWEQNVCVYVCHIVHHIICFVHVACHLTLPPETEPPSDLLLEALLAS
jgi:hypothetical protein